MNVQKMVAAGLLPLLMSVLLAHPDDRDLVKAAILAIETACLLPENVEKLRKLKAIGRHPRSARAAPAQRASHRIVTHCAHRTASWRRCHYGRTGALPRRSGAQRDRIARARYGIAISSPLGLTSPLHYSAPPPLLSHVYSQIRKGPLWSSGANSC